MQLRLIVRLWNSKCYNQSSIKNKKKTNIQKF